MSNVEQLVQMTKDFSHDITQPLFAMSLSIENLANALDQEREIENREAVVREILGVMMTCRENSFALLRQFQHECSTFS